MRKIERKIRLEDEKIFRENYQIRMIRENEPKGFLPVSCYVRENKSYFDYVVTGKSSIKAIYEKSEINWKDLLNLVKQILEVIHVAEKYLLDIHKILLKPEYIFYEEETYYFCYYPLAEQDFWEEFKFLTQYFVKKADYQDELCTRMICILNNGSMEENYSLEKLIQDCMDEHKKALERDSLYVMKSTIRKDDLFAEDDNYLNKEETEESVEEKERETFFDRLFGRKKKAKWGEWEAL